MVIDEIHRAPEIFPVLRGLIDERRAAGQRFGHFLLLGSAALERDVPMFAPRMPAETLGRLWTMLAHLQGGLLNQAQLGGSLGVSAPTVARYIDLLSDLHLVRRLMPWCPDIAIEVKRSTAPSPDRGFGQACDDLGIEQRWVVYPGTETFPLRHGAQAIGLVELAAALAK